MADNCSVEASIIASQGNWKARTGREPSNEPFLKKLGIRNEP